MSGRAAGNGAAVSASTFEGTQQVLIEGRVEVLRHQEPTLIDAEDRSLLVHREELGDRWARTCDDVLPAAASRRSRERRVFAVWTGTYFMADKDLGQV